MTFYQNAFFNRLRPCTVTVNRPNFGSSSVAMDLYRMAPRIMIDDRVLSTLSVYPDFQKKYGQEITPEIASEMQQRTVNTFFSEYLLKGFPQEGRENILWYLNKTFHQGGILIPAGACMALIQQEGYVAKIEKPREDAIFIKTTDRGFKLQNIYKQSLFELESLSTEHEKEIQVAAEVILDIDFTKIEPEEFNKIISQIKDIEQKYDRETNNRQREQLKALREQLGAQLSPIITVEKSHLYTNENKISSKILTQSSILKTILDFIKSLFGIWNTTSICSQGDKIFDQEKRPEATRPAAIKVVASGSSESLSDQSFFGGSVASTALPAAPSSSSGISLEDVPKKEASF